MQRTGGRTTSAAVTYNWTGRHAHSTTRYHTPPDHNTTPDTTLVFSKHLLGGWLMYALKSPQLPSHITTLVISENQELDKLLN